MKCPQHKGEEDECKQGLTDVTPFFSKLRKNHEAKILKGRSWPVQIMDPSSCQTMDVLKDDAREEEPPFLGENLELDRRLRGDPPHYLGDTASKVEGRHACWPAALALLPTQVKKEGGEHGFLDR